LSDLNRRFEKWRYKLFRDALKRNDELIQSHEESGENRGFEISDSWAPCAVLAIMVSVLHSLVMVLVWQPRSRDLLWVDGLCSLC
jgi:hypothetical protein